MIYKVKRKVTGSMVDTKANLSLLGLCDVIVDTMSEMLGLLKLDGLYALKNYNAMWVISKNKIRILDKAKWNEELEVESFISSTTLARITIDTVIKKLDKIIAYSRIESCAIDLQSRRIRRTNTMGIDENITIENPYNFNQFLETRDECNDLKLEFTQKSLYTNIDYLHHTNNLEYIRVLLNSFTVKEIEIKPIKQIEINYKNQSFENDLLEVYKNVSENICFYEIKANNKNNVKETKVNGKIFF